MALPEGDPPELKTGWTKLDNFVKELKPWLWKPARENIEAEYGSTKKLKAGGGAELPDIYVVLNGTIYSVTMIIKPGSLTEV